jgi:hypothetical protein
MRKEAIFIAGALPLVAAAPAHAATARVVLHCDDNQGKECYYVVLYTAASGETNVLSAERHDGRLAIRDAGATIAAGAGCLPIAGGVDCGAPGDAYWVDAYLDDGDDVSTAPGIIRGGRGNDRLTADTGALTGGPGDDVLTAMHMTVRLVDGDGRVPGHDVYRGGSVSYFDREKGVRADLRPGHRSEDEFIGTQQVIGGKGDDVLIGDEASNDLNGGPGSDRLVGLGGNDSLETGVGTGDVVDAGAGDDQIYTEGKSVDCGPGHDSVSSRPRSLLDGCEFVDRGLLTARLATTGSAFFTTAVCELCDTSHWTVTARGHTVGTFTSKTVARPLRLNALGRRWLRRDRRLTVRVTQRSPGTPFATGFQTVLRLR